ncbi:MAG: MFS transporter [Terriglobales bacterium]
MKSEAPGVESTSPPIWKDQVFWFVIALGVGYGAVYNFLPASFPAFTRQFGCSLAQMGQLQLLFFLSSLGFSLVGGSLIALLGLKRSAMMAFIVAAAALLLISQSHRFVLVMFGAALFGFAISAMIVINSSIISGHFRAKRQSVFFITGLSDAGGSMIGPAMLGWWLANSIRWGLSWRVSYMVAAADMGALFVWALLVRSNVMGDAARNPGSESGVFSHTRDVLSSGALYIAVALGFCHGLAQAGMLSFVGQLYIHRLHIDAAHAAYFISGNAAGILSGRLMFSWITAHWKLPELVVICVCAAAETAAFFGAILSRSYILGIVMFVIAGIFVSTIGPSLNSYLGGKFASSTATAFSLFAGLSNMGAALGPFVIGMIGTSLGVGKGILFAPAFSALLSTMAVLWFLRERARDGEGEVTVAALLG